MIAAKAEGTFLTAFDVLEDRIVSRRDDLQQSKSQDLAPYCHCKTPKPSPPMTPELNQVLDFDWPKSLINFRLGGLRDSSCCVRHVSTSGGDSQLASRLSSDIHR